MLRSVVLAGGGTGGHIYPLLAFADALRRRFPQVRITTLGSPKGMENELIPAAGYDLRVIPAFQLLGVVPTVASSLLSALSL